MRLNNQTFSIILICFALVGKCVSTFHDTPKPKTSLFSSTPSPTPSDGRKTKTNYPPETSHFPDSPYMVSPSDAPSPLSSYGGGYAYGSSSSFSEFLKGKFTSHGPKPNYNPALVKICGHTRNPDVCLATVSPLLKHKFDVVHVLQAAITVATQHIKITIAGIERHAAVSREIGATLADCKGHYTKALGNLQKAMEAIHARNFGTVTIMLSGVLADVSSAESKIEDLKSSKLKLENYSFVSVAASNCLSIASLIRN